MSRGAYYNEIDPYAAEWLRNLIAAGHIAPGDVDTRSIADVRPEDVADYAQAHFFAGIGAWSHALRLAGVADDDRVWTGSCPCQPFSTSGRGAGFADPRDLWPTWRRIIEVARPARIFGEQVSGPRGLAWFDRLCDDLETDGYAVGAVDLCAAGAGAPHIRQRLYWTASMADADPQRRRIERRTRPDNAESDRCGATGELADADGKRVSHVGPGEVAGETRSVQGETRERQRLWAGTGQHGGARRLDDSAHARLEGQRGHGDGGDEPGRQPAHSVGHATPPSDAPVRSYWSDAVWIPCRDGTIRPTQPGIFPLAHGATGRVGRLRAGKEALTRPSRSGMLRCYGNAIVPQVASMFIRAAMLQDL